MRSAFFEFSVATTGLFASKGALEVTSHNVANASTPGYSRQYAELRAHKPITYYDGRGMIGTGADYYGVGQIRNFYLDTKYWTEQSVFGEYEAKSVQMSMVEKVFAEMSQAGTLSGFDKFFNSMQDLKTSAGDDVYRTNVLQTSLGLSKYINNVATSLKKYQSDINEEVKTVVMQINSIGNQIAGINNQIANYELDGSRANDLRDARAVLIDELSKYVNVSVQEVEMNEDYAAGLYPEPEDRVRSKKVFYVTLDGHEFVSGFDVRGLEAVPRDLPKSQFTLSGNKKNPADVDGLVDVYFKFGGGKLDIYSPSLQGQLKGLIDTRDGNNEFYTKSATPINIAQGDTTITIAPDPSMRLDSNPNLPGTMTIYNADGTKFDVEYTSFTKSGGNYTFKLTKSFPVNSKNATITVGKTNTYKGIPHYFDKLNELVRTFTKAINEGIDRKGNPIPGVSGIMNGFDANGQKTGTLANGTSTGKNWSLFTNGNNIYPITDYNDLNCENFTVNKYLIENPKLLGAALAANGGVSDNRVILEVINLKNFNDMFSQGKIADYVIGIAGEIGVDVSQAKKFEVNYSELTVSIDNQRKSVSGVDLNEEMTNMIKYQQVYQASSKLINVIDEIYDITINRLGAF